MTYLHDHPYSDLQQYGENIKSLQLHVGQRIKNVCKFDDLYQYNLTQQENLGMVRG